VAKQVQSESDRLAAEELEKNPITPKGHRTPTRKEQEAQRKRPLVGGKTPEARALSKDQQRTQRERARVGMANGEEKYLPVRDRGPQKRFIRDYVDARWSIGELVIPVLGIVVLVTIILPTTQTVGTIALYGFIVLVAIDLVVLTVMLRRALAAKFGATKVDRLGIYHATRTIQLRVMRLPKPQVKRGGAPN
jgi:Protein of unknown function (DUF3043)